MGTNPTVSPHFLIDSSEPNTIVRYNQQLEQGIFMRAGHILHHLLNQFTLTHQKLNMTHLAAVLVITAVRRKKDRTGTAVILL